MVLNLATRDRNDLIVSIIANSLGRGMIGMPQGDHAWTGAGPTQSALFPVYLDFVQRARDPNYPELRLMFELIRYRMEARDPSAIPELLAGIDDLSLQDRGFLIDAFGELLQESWRTPPNALSRRIAARARAVLTDHGQQSLVLRQIPL